MTINDGDPIHVAICRDCGPICASNSQTSANVRSNEHATATNHITYVTQIAFTAGK